MELICSKKNLPVVRFIDIIFPVYENWIKLWLAIDVYITFLESWPKIYVFKTWDLKTIAVYFELIS